MINRRNGTKWKSVEKNLSKACQGSKHAQEKKMKLNHGKPKPLPSLMRIPGHHCLSAAAGSNHTGCLSEATASLGRSKTKGNLGVWLGSMAFSFLEHGNRDESLLCLMCFFHDFVKVFYGFLGFTGFSTHLFFG